MKTELLDFMLNSCTEGFWEWDLVTDRACLSQRYCELIGYTADDTVFDSHFLQSLIHPDDHDSAFRIINEHLQGIQSDSVIEHRIITKDGSIKWIRERGVTSEYDENGAPRRIVGIIADITGRKQTEASLIASEEKFRLFFEYSMNAVLFTIPDGSILRANPATCRMFGWSEPELCLIRREGILDTGDIRFDQALEERQRTGSLATELTGIRKNGDRFPVEVSSVIVPGNSSRSFVILRDISSRKQAEAALVQANNELHGAMTELVVVKEQLEERVIERTVELKQVAGSLRESEERFRSIFEQSLDAMIISEQDGIIANANPAACTMFGMNEEELRLTGRAGIMDTSDPRFHSSVAKEKQHGLVSEELVGIRKGGERFPVEARSVITNKEKMLSFVILHDITEWKRAEAALTRKTRLYETLYAANQAIIRAKDQQSLFQEICAIIVEYGGFLIAWIGFEDVATRLVSPVASAGSAIGYLDGIRIHTIEGTSGNGPTGRAIREGTSQINNCFLKNENTALWHARAKKFWINASAAFPLFIFAKPVAALTIYADAPNYFTPDYTGHLSGCTGTAY